MLSPFRHFPVPAEATVSAFGPGLPSIAPPLADGAGDGLDDAVAGRQQVWPLRPDWPAILRDALALRPRQARLGDGLSSLVLSGPLRWCEPAAAAGAPAGAACLGAALGRWACAMAERSPLADGRWRHGLVFFDDQGHAVLRLELGTGPGDASVHAPFHALVRRHALDDAVRRAAPRRRPARRAEPAAAPRASLPLAAEPAPDDLVEALACEAVLEVLRSAAAADLALRVSYGCRGARGEWSGRLQRLGCIGGRALAQGPGIGLQWHEQLPGQQAWLLRRPTGRGLRQSLLLFGPGGELCLQLSALGEDDRPEPCAWRAAIETARGGQPGRAC